jgi:hypothetical protein
MHFAHQAQLNAHVWPLETKMAVGHVNNEYIVSIFASRTEQRWMWFINII